MRVGAMEHYTFKASDPPLYGESITSKEHVGKPIGLKELLYRRGLLVPGMSRYVSVPQDEHKWRHDLLLRLEDTAEVEDLSRCSEVCSGPQWGTAAHRTTSLRGYGTSTSST